ncbi:type II secretion system F family protein [Clostridium algidicarnis]|uniref:type II secretion system F family protein n=1 Tax=Clostridium algidicarnis TaxID=37659 RepID=UPI001C0CBCAB|nr:type II secretion system F family protein [Clostridium algidicarnis]MBU3196308.1 type II secretion system F family protein [Clostridium algidicarnis]
MPNYKYKAMNTEGQRIEGTYSGDSKEAVMDMIKSNSYYPLKVEELREKTNLDIGRFKKVSTKDISIFCRQFYTMLDAGSSINSSLHILALQLPNKKLKEAIALVEDEVRKGSTLSEAMSNQQEVFPELLVSMVETGEVSGNLDSVMLRMSKHYEKENRINNKIKSAMIYPLVLAVVAISVIVFILAFIMPMFVDMFKDGGIELPLSTRILLSASNGIKSHGILILIILILIGFFINYYFKSESGKEFSSKFKLAFPVIKRLNQKIIVSRFTRTLSTVLASGIPLVQALQVVNGVIGNRVAERELEIVKDKVIKGEGLAEPIAESKIFPVMLSSMIKIGEESGSLDDILNKTADFYDEELENEIQTATALIEPIMIAVMGLILGFIIISIITPVFGMYNTV